MFRHLRPPLSLFSALSFILTLVVLHTPAWSDETCQSPYMAKITGVEEFVYVWTLGAEGVGDGSDKLVTVDVREDSETFGQVIASVSVGGRHEAHHGGLTDDRRYFWVGGLDDSQIYIFDIYSDPANPRLHTTIHDFEAASGGAVGPHVYYALPGRMMIASLSNSTDKGGQAAIVEYTNSGSYISTHWIPNAATSTIPGAEFADGYGYDARVLPRKNVMLSSSFTGHNNYMRDLEDLMSDDEAMANFGNSMVLWNLHTRQPLKAFSTPGAPLEIRWAIQDDHNYAFTTTALTSKIWLVYEDDQGEWQADAVADIGNAADIPLPVDISLSSDDNFLWVDTFMDGMARLFDVSDPHNPKQVFEKKIGAQVNMVSQSWDGKRVYFTSSLLANWDKKGADNEQYLKAYTWNGEALVDRFEIDFWAAGLGRPHVMRFGSRALYGM